MDSAGLTRPRRSRHRYITRSRGRSCHSWTQASDDGDEERCEEALVVATYSPGLRNVTKRTWVAMGAKDRIQKWTRALRISVLGLVPMRAGDE